jgi:hypothetical protein
LGGGIVAALPLQMGLGTFSPCLDSHGNSVRGLRVCKALSARFDLHILNRSADVRTCIIADYNAETRGFLHAGKPAIGAGTACCGAGVRRDRGPC